MPERENFGRELQPRAGRGAKRGQHGDEQRSHAARERYQSVARNCNGHNRYGIFSRDNPAATVRMRKLAITDEVREESDRHPSD
jgi:hypothetical protein